MTTIKAVVPIVSPRVTVPPRHTVEAAFYQAWDAAKDKGLELRTFIYQGIETEGSTRFWVWKGEAGA